MKNKTFICSSCNSKIKFGMIYGSGGDTYTGIKCDCRSYGYEDDEETGYFGALELAKEWSNNQRDSIVFCKFNHIKISKIKCKQCEYVDMDSNFNNCILYSLYSYEVIQWR